MTRRNKYLIGAALGVFAAGLAVVAATRLAPRMKTRMEAHCREMMGKLVKAEDKRREGEPISS